MMRMRPPGFTGIFALPALIAALAILPSRPSGESPGISVTAAARSVRPGELVVLTIVTAAPATSVRARAFGRDLLPFAIDAKTWRVLAGIDLETAPRTYPVTVEAGGAGAVSRATHRLVVVPRKFPTRTLTVDPAFVNPPASALPRIERETAELNQLWANSAATRLWDGPFSRPVPDAANSAFGTRTILNGEPRSPHSGADFNSATGTPIKAPNGGRVVVAGDRYFTGNTVMIDHGLALFSLFAHLSEIDVHVGDVVTTDEVIGKVGATGRVTGPHLHWSVRVNGARVDPLSLLSVLGTGSGREQR
jgi:peptidase M23-like protein